MKSLEEQTQEVIDEAGKKISAAIADGMRGVPPLAGIAIDISRLIHDQCKDVPHDIGLQVMNLIADKYHVHISSGGRPNRREYTRGDVMFFTSLALALRDAKIEGRAHPTGAPNDG